MKDNDEQTTTKRVGVRPALTPEAWEARLAGLAMSLAEQQLRDGTASSQVITACLKLGSTREKLEQEQIARNIELTDAKRDKIYADRDNEEIYRKALEAMQIYKGAEADESIVVSNDEQIIQ